MASASFDIDVTARILGADDAASRLGTFEKKLFETGAAAEKLDASLAKPAASLKKVEGASSKGGIKVNELGAAMGKLPGPAGQAGQSVFNVVDGVKKLVSNLGPAAGAIAAVIVVVVALVAGLVLATIAITTWAIGLADAARNSAITIDAASRLSDSLANLGEIVPKVQRATGLATDKIIDLAKQLDKAGVKADDMADALKAVAIAEAAGGPEAVAKIVDSLKEGKSAAEALAEAQKKWGDIVAKKANSLDSLWDRFKRSIADTFGGLNIEPLLAGLAKLVDFFDSSTASGKALKFLFETIFQPIVDAAAAALPYVEAALLRLVIWALKAYIAFQEFSKTTTFAVLVTVLKIVGVALLAIVATSALIGALLTALFLAPIAAIGLLVAGISWVIGVIADFVSAGIAAWDALASTPGNAVNTILGWVGSFVSAGADLVAGIAQGIMGGASAVVSAVLRVAGSAVDAVKGALGIHSPSAVMAALGEHTSEGFAQGVEGGEGRTQSALEGVTSPPIVKGGATGAGGRTIGDITINVSAGGGAQDIASAVREAVLSVLEGDFAPAPA